MNIKYKVIDDITGLIYNIGDDHKAYGFFCVKQKCMIGISVFERKSIEAFWRIPHEKRHIDRKMFEL